eukprot:TRINITY_DN4296_c0_g1_i2.p1 TRINITY_DN4296_c0_g1~~TRINITY_DN4296_c0_g1_i2.p1  ORF type:complete len:157 (+),score=21.72 TRINITY_DN4296_c0_g1_i2:182-652(+)
MTKQPVSVDVFEMVMNDDPEEEMFGKLFDVLAKPRIRRQVWLMTSVSKQRLMYATSWWSSKHMDAMMSDQSKPIWSNLQGKDLFRDMRGLMCGNSEALEQKFGSPGPFWGRYYLFWHRGEPICLIYEVFSSSLHQFLGPERHQDVSLLQWFESNSI